MPLKHFIDFNDLTVPEWNQLYSLIDSITEHPEDYRDSCRGKLMATLFYEPSTRTMLSFQAAMMRLGGNVIGFDNPGNSSVSKGENLRDTIRIVGGYSDVIVMRNPLEGAAFAASLYSGVPVINAGDGGHLHPTQTLTDLTTIFKEKGCLEGLTIGVCGDLKYGRTVHSLLKAMALFKNNKFYLISTFQLKTPKYITDFLKKNGNEFYEVETIEECIGDLDCLYMTRIQKERFSSEAAYLQQKNVYVLDSLKMKKAKKDMIVMHPLPKVDEISQEVDFDPRAVYFKQAKYGMYARMALVLKMTEKPLEPPVMQVSNERHLQCPNPRCITNTEKYLPELFYTSEGTRVTKTCRYCDFNAK